MSHRQTIAPQAAPTARSSFFQQRDALVSEIANSMEHVLQNINKLNRSLESVIAVGNEFGAVEALWSHFEDVMAKEPGADKDQQPDGEEDEEDWEEEGNVEGAESEGDQGGKKADGR